MNILKIHDKLDKVRGKEIPVRRVKTLYANKYSKDFMEAKAELDKQKESK